MPGVGGIRTGMGVTRLTVAQTLSSVSVCGSHSIGISGNVDVPNVGSVGVP